MSLDNITEKILAQLKRAKPFFETYIDIKEGKFFVSIKKGKITKIPADYELENMEELYEAFPALHSLAWLYDIDSQSNNISNKQKKVEDLDASFSNKIEKIDFDIENLKKRLDNYKGKIGKSRGKKELNGGLSYADLAEKTENEIKEIESSLIEVKEAKLAIQDEFLAIPEKIEELNNYVNSAMKASKDLDEELENAVFDYYVNISEKHEFDIDESTQTMLKPSDYASNKVYELLKLFFIRHTKKIKKKTSQRARPVMSDEEMQKELEKRLPPELRKTPKKESSIMHHVENIIDKEIKKEVSFLKNIWRNPFGKVCLIIGGLAAFVAGVNLANKTFPKKPIYPEKTIISEKTEKDEISNLIKDLIYKKFRKENNEEINFLHENFFRFKPLKDFEYCEKLLCVPSQKRTFKIRGNEYQIEGYNKWEKKLYLTNLTTHLVEKYEVKKTPGDILDNIPDFFFIPDQNLPFGQPIDIEKVHGKVRLLETIGTQYHFRGEFEKFYAEIKKIENNLSPHGLNYNWDLVFNDGKFKYTINNPLVSVSFGSKKPKDKFQVLVKVDSETDYKYRFTKTFYLKDFKKK